MNTLALERAEHGIVTDLSRLLRSRYWAQHLKLFSREAARNMLLGNSHSRFRGRGMEFEEVRRYQPGDDVRTIDWKVSARARGTYTKLFCEERERPCHLVVDQRSALYFGSQRQFKSVLAAELGTAIGWAALAGGDRVGGQVLGDYRERDSRARRNKQAVLRLIQDLHEFNHALGDPHADIDMESQRPTSIANSLEECRRITRPGTAVFIISGFHDFDQVAAKALSRLGKHTDITLLHIVDSMEQELPFSGSIAISNGEHSTNIRLSNDLQRAYQARLAAQQDLLKNAISQARALYTKIDTAQTARQALAKVFTG